MGVNLTSAGPAEQAAPKRYSSGDLETSLRELVSDGSLEFSGGDAAQIDEVAEFLPFGTPGKNALVRWIYSAYSGRRSVMVFSSSATPDTFSSKRDIRIGESTVHQPPAATANR